MRAVTLSRGACLLCGLAIVLSSLLVACGGSGDDTVTARVGIVLSLSGSAAAYGQSSRHGIELALDEINTKHSVKGVSIDATFEDDTGSAEQSAERFRKLIDAGVSAIIGPTLSNSAFTTDPLAAQAGIPVLAVSNTAPGITELGDTIFRVSLAESAVLPKTIEAAAAGGTLHSAALIIATDDAFSVKAGELMRQAAVVNGIEIVSEHEITTTDTHFGPILDEIQQSAPDAIMIAALTNASAAVVSQARGQGMQQRFICGNQCNTPAFIAAAGPAAEGLLVGAAWNIAVDYPESRDFVSAYRIRYGSDPDQFAAQGYTGIYILAKALAKAGGADHAALVKALGSLGSLQTVLGAFQFDPGREAQQRPIIQVVRDGAYELFQE